MAAAWKMVIAAGGTGGHISPALAIAEHLARVEPECRMEFVCGTRPVELAIYQKAGVEPVVMDIRPLSRGLRGLPVNLFRLLRALRTARGYLRVERPDMVLGMGGYVCVPVVVGAVGQGIPTMIHEQNAVAGRANRWLGRRVRAIACAYEAAAGAFPASKCRVTGNPVRTAFVGGDRGEALARWNLASEVPILLIFGGSQGARRLNEIVLDTLGPLDGAAADFGGLQLVWICGENNFDALNERIRNVSWDHLAIRLVPFVREMGLAYAAADLAVTRAGAMTLAEITANGIPAIVVPFPGATAGHQRLNARPLAKAGAALLVAEQDLHGGRLARELSALFSDRSRLEVMSRASRRLGRPGAAEDIVGMIAALRGK